MTEFKYIYIYTFICNKRARRVETAAHYYLYSSNMLALKSVLGFGSSLEISKILHITYSTNLMFC
jgi:hypothetical protein